MMETAAEIIALLGLEPHPEGGHFRETFRDEAVDANGRSRSTAIYFLLAEGERSHWHRIDAVEVWHYYAGAPLMLLVSDDSGLHAVELGPDLLEGEQPQAIVPPHAWQAATAPATGPWSAAPWRRASTLRRSRSRHRAGCRPKRAYFTLPF